MSLLSLYLWELTTLNFLICEAVSNPGMIIRYAVRTTGLSIYNIDPRAFFPIQCLSIWQHPSKGSEQILSNSLKLPAGSYNNWITGKVDGKPVDETNGSLIRAALWVLGTGNEGQPVESQFATEQDRSKGRGI